MNTMRTTLVHAFVTLGVIVSNVGWCAGMPKLAAPVYKGAVPAVLADGTKADPFYIQSFGGVKALDCSGRMDSHNNSGNTISAGEAQKAGDYPGPWCFLTRDPISKVKAFYDKAIGPMHEIKGRSGDNGQESSTAYEVLAERAWLPDSSINYAGYNYTGVSLHSLPPPKAVGDDAYQMYSGSRHFNGFLTAVDWFGEPGKHKQSELNSLYNKHKQLESAMFQRKGPKHEEMDTILQERYTKKLEQAQLSAAGVPAGQQPKSLEDMTPEQIIQMQKVLMGQMGQAPDSNSHTPSADTNDAKLKAFMKQNPKAGKRYVELTQKMGSLMQAGKMDEADAVDAELQKLEETYPELADIESSSGDSEQAQNVATSANAAQSPGVDTWNNWLDYINEAEKQAYYTLIVIDNGFRGNEKDYTRNQKVITANSKGWVAHQHIWDFVYPADQASN